MDQPVPSAPPLTVELHITAAGPERRREPVTCGVPWPRGALNDLTDLRLHDEQGRPRPLQARALNRWPDGSVRWSLLDWQADVHGTGVSRLTVAPEGAAAVPEAPRLRTETPPGEAFIDTGAACFHLRGRTLSAGFRAGGGRGSGGRRADAIHRRG